MDRVIIFDTTLRDGEQSPGFSMNTMEKLEMAPTCERGWTVMPKTISRKIPLGRS